MKNIYYAPESASLTEKYAGIDMLKTYLRARSRRKNMYQQDQYAGNLQAGKINMQSLHQEDQHVRNT